MPVAQPVALVTSVAAANAEPSRSKAEAVSVSPVSAASDPPPSIQINGNPSLGYSSLTDVLAGSAAIASKGFASTTPDHSRTEAVQEERGVSLAKVNC